jgi:hypothetical protein
MADFTTYQPPGLYTEAVQGQQLMVRSSTPVAIGLFGVSVGYREQTESLTINPDVLNEDGTEYSPANTKVLMHPGVLVETLTVRNPFSGVVYAEGVDYNVVKVDANQTSSLRDDLYVIRRTMDGVILQGDSIEVHYRYTDPTYFDPKMFWDFDDLRDQYGPPFDDSGNIVSEITLAASLAFMNGARTIITCAVDVTGSTPTLENYQTALNKLRDNDTIQIICSTTGMEQIQEIVKSHVNQQSRSRFERRAILGRDGSAVAVPPSHLIANAQTLGDRRVALVGPSRMKYFVPSLNKEVIIGGQYLAAAVAGVSASQMMAMPLTRRQVLGFADMGESHDETQKNLQSAAGVMVVERTRRNRIQVRHGVTTNPQRPLDREWSITGQEDAMIYRIRDFLDSDDIIGNIIDEIMLSSIKGSAEAALQSLKGDRTINDYRNLKIRQVNDQPDVVEVRFEWKPSMPLNYIIVRYSVSTTSGDATLQTI